MSGMIVSNIEVAQRALLNIAFVVIKVAQHGMKGDGGLQSSSLKMLTTLGFSGNRPILVGACRLVRSVPVIPESSWWVNSLSCHCGDCRPAHCTFGHMHSSHDVWWWNFQTMLSPCSVSMSTTVCLKVGISDTIMHTSACNNSMGHVSSAL